MISPRKTVPLHTLASSLSADLRLVSATRTATNDLGREVHALRAQVAGSIPEIVELLKGFGFDASAYKPGWLEDWIAQRMLHLELRAVGEYASRLCSSEMELRAFVHHVLNGATAFFRDSSMWKRLDLALDQLLPSLPTDRELRVWNPGCSTGEETYSIAMLLEQAIRRHRMSVRYTVAASDINAEAIAIARKGFYSQDALADVPAEIRRRFFTCEGSGYAAHPTSKAVFFACRDIFKNFAVQNVDLLVCRNLFIYLRPAYRDWLVSRFHYAMRPGGILFLGPADAIGEHDGFSAVEHSDRIYRRRSGPPDVRAVLARPESLNRFLPFEARRRWFWVPRK